MVILSLMACGAPEQFLKMKNEQQNLPLGEFFNDMQQLHWQIKFLIG